MKLGTYRHFGIIEYVVSKRKLLDISNIAKCSIPSQMHVENKHQHNIHMVDESTNGRI